MSDPAIEPSAIVEDGATIGTGSRVWHHAHVRSGAKIGEACVLGKNVFVDTGVFIGDGVKIQNNVSVFNGVRIESEAFIGPSVVFTNDLLPRSAGGWSTVPTLVDHGASIGANATVVCGNRLGRWSVVAAGAVVTSSVAPHQVVAGNPARHHGWACRCGEIVSRAEPYPAGMACPHCHEVLPEASA